MNLSSSYSSYLAHFTRQRRVGFAAPNVVERLRSKRALERRLVLPLEYGHWMRALEILGASYAVAGRNPHHVEQVLQCIVAPPAGSTQQQQRRVLQRDLIPVLDMMREQLLDGTLPCAGATWVRLVKAYVAVGARVEEVVDVASQALRFGAHRLVKENQATELVSCVLPILAAVGRYDEAKALVDTAPLSEFDRSKNHQIQRWLGEAAAASGRNGDAAVSHLLSLTRSSTPNEPTRREETAEGPDAESVTATASASTNHSVNGKTARLTAAASSLGYHGVLGLLLSIATSTPQRPARSGNPTFTTSAATTATVDDDPRWAQALSLYALFLRRLDDSDQPVLPHHRYSMVVQADRLVLNELGRAQRWLDALNVWQRCIAPRQQQQQPSSSSSSPSPFLLDEASIHLVLESLIAACEPQPSLSSDHVVIKMLNYLCTSCDHWRMSNRMGAIFAEALLASGDWLRAINILGSTPLMKGKAAAAVSGSRSLLPSVTLRDGGAGDDNSEYEDRRQGERSVAALLYGMLRCADKEPRAASSAVALDGGGGSGCYAVPPGVVPYLLHRFAFAIPKDLFRDALVRSNISSGDNNNNKCDDRAAVEDGLEASSSSISLKAHTAGRWESSPRRYGIQHYWTYGCSRSVAQRTEAMEQQLKRNAVRFGGDGDRSPAGRFVGNPHRDPRPIPKGLHDYASGWAGYNNGRNGEMIFSNSRTSAHPLQPWPKQMRALRDENRGWNPRLNSSHAHTDNVRKWNGKSSV